MIVESRKSTARAAIVIGAIGPLASCTPDEGVLPGQETGPCVEGECLGQLVCLSDICVDPDSQTGTDGSGPVVTATATATMSTTVNVPSSSGVTETRGTDPSTSMSLDGSTDPTTAETVTATDGATMGTMGVTDTMDTMDTMGASSTGPGEQCTVPPHVPCDALANNLFNALGVNCPGEPVVGVMSTGSAAAMVTRSSFGGTNEWDPREGSAFAVLGSGFTVDLDLETPPGDSTQAPTHCSDDLGAMFDLMGGPPAPIDVNGVAGDCTADDTLIGTGDCSGSLSSLVGLIADYTEIRLEAEVPATVTSMSYEFAFFSTEYPFYVGSEFNDIHIAWLESERWTGNIAFDGLGNPVSVNSVLLDIPDDAGNAPEFAGTCMRLHAGTSWSRSVAPVESGETITLILAISDVSDSILDSYVFLDNFAWGCDEIDEPSTMPAP